MITVEVNDSAVRLKLDAMPDKVRSGVKLTVGILAEKLRTHIVQDLLRGQVLNRRTGALGDNEFYQVEETPQGIMGKVYVGSSIHYAAIHEYGAVFDRLVSVAWGKPMKHPHNVTFHYPERSYQRRGLNDMREEIVTSLRDAVMKSVQL